MFGRRDRGSRDLVSRELRSALQTLGNAAIGVALGLAVLGIALVISNFATGQGSVALSTPMPAASISNLAAVATSSATPPAPPPTTAPASPTPPASPTDPPSTSTPTPPPAARPEALTVTAYTSGGRRYAALRAPVGYEYTSPLAGTVQIRLYQLIEGEVRVGSNIPTLAFYPYVIVTAADRRVTFRPGANNVDTELLVPDGARVEPGSPLFKTIGAGASSWATFYDRGVTANVIASVVALPGETEVDPVAFFTRR